MKIPSSDFLNPLHWEEGFGSQVSLSNGQKYFDLCSGATVANLGQGNDRIAKKVYEAFSNLSNTFYFSNQYRIEYTDLLLSELPDEYEHVLFFSSGGEAIDNSIKIALHSKRKPKIISTPTSYHGRTFGGYGLSKLPFTLYMNDVLKFNIAYLFNFPIGNVSTEERLSNSLKELETLLEKHDDISALLIEPYQGDGGMIFPHKCFFKKMASLCKDNGVLFILDEIQSGFHRTGPLFAFMELGITPDIVCFGKAMANGVPGSGLIVKKGIIEHISHEMFATSFSGNPVTMSAAIEVLKVMKEMNAGEEVPRKGRILKEGLLQIKNEFPDMITDIRGRGLVVGIELSLKTSLGRIIGDVFLRRAFEEGLLLMPLKGENKNVIKISPPLVISDDEIKEILDKIRSVFNSLK